MIVVDFNQVTIASITMQLTLNKGVLEEDLVRHMVLNSLRMYHTKFKAKYGEMIICADATQYWRKDLFKFYKAHRKEDQKESSIDWNLLFQCLNKIRDEVAEFFPYRVLRVPHAEADDLIGSLCHEFGKQLGGDPILIVSGDKDFKQLQKYSNVDQWAPVQKKFIRENNPAMYLKEHIIRGDSGDGVPNFLADDDTLINADKKQPKIYKTKVAEWLKMEPEEFCDEDMMVRWKRNEALVDLDNIPDNIQEETISQYHAQEGKDRSKLFNYFINNKLMNLMDNITEF